MHLRVHSLLVLPEADLLALLILIFSCGHILYISVVVAQLAAF